MEPEQQSRLAALRAKFDSEGPSSLTEAEGTEFVKLMRAEAAYLVSERKTARSKPKAEPKLAPAPSADAFKAKLAAMMAKKGTQ